MFVLCVHLGEVVYVEQPVLQRVGRDAELGHAEPHLAAVLAQPAADHHLPLLLLRHPVILLQQCQGLLYTVIFRSDRISSFYIVGW